MRQVGRAETERELACSHQQQLSLEGYLSAKVPPEECGVSTHARLPSPEHRSWEEAPTKHLTVTSNEESIHKRETQVDHRHPRKNQHTNFIHCHSPWALAQSELKWGRD